MDRYEEALAKARVEYEKARKQGYTWLMDLLEGMFPELKESEDEKFQKYILKVCKECVEANNKGLELSMSTTKKLLSYLEKQKDKMTMEEYENSELFQLKLKTKYANGYQDGLVQKEQSITANDLDEEIHRFFDDCIDVHEAKLYGNISERVIPLVCYELTARHFAKWGEKQKEQKPSESCDGICCGDDRFKIIAEARKDIIEKTNIAENELSMELPLLDGILMRVWQVGWLNKKQKQAGWSKEDEEMRINILQEIANIKDMFPKINIKPEFDWLKSLPERFNLQLKNEWSEDWREEDIQTRFAFYTYKDDPSVLYLSNVFVEETSRNHGFGTRILRAAEKVAETIGATTISLKVKQNSHANAWYRKNGYGYVAFEDGYDWLEKNLEYMKPDKSVEWSEKEMAYCMKLTISAIEYYYDAENPFRDKLIHWLKSLRPQQKQEWSKEDEMYLSQAIETLEHENYSILADKLKSLRPPQYCENCKLKRSVENWKPSEQ